MKSIIQNIFIFLFIFVFSLLISALSYIKYNEIVAQNISVVLRNDILKNDLVKVGFIFEQFKENSFSDIRIENKDYHSTKSVFNHDVQIPLYLDSNESVYNKNIIFKINLTPVYLFSFLVSLVSLILIKRYLKYQLQELKKELDQRNKREKEQMLVKITSEFIHDIKSPLATLEVSLNKVSGNETFALSNANQAIERIKEISASYIEQDNENENWSDLIILNNELENILSEKSAEHSNNITFTNSCLKSPFIIADRRKFNRIISNLINNSIEANSSNPSIEVLLESNSKETILTILDNGPGFEQKVLDNSLFSPLSTKPSGKGIGLSSAHYYLKMWGGNIKLCNKSNGGAKIEIKFRNFCDYQIIHIEDDELLQLVWKSEGKKITSEFYSFSEINDDFFNVLKKKDSIIYLDSNLGEIQGEDYIPEILKTGNFDKKIFMQTGKDKKSFKQCEGIVGVTDKKPNWLKKRISSQ